MTATEPTSNNHGGRPVFDQDRAERAIRELLLACGEDPDRDGLQDTPARVARAYREMFAGLDGDPDELLTRTFDESHEELVLVTDIPMYSTCGPAGQIVDAIAGAKPAEDVVVGDRLRTLAGGRVAGTTVAAIGSHRTSALVEVTTSACRFGVTPGHPLATPQGWQQAKDIEWTAVRKPGRQLAVAGARSAGPGSGSWFRRYGFAQDDYVTDLSESEYVAVRPVRPIGPKLSTVYSFTCDPHPAFLIDGHLTHNCEHHLLSFHGVAHIGHIPNSEGKVTGLSKLARLVDPYVKRPRVQERLTSQVADALERKLGPRGLLRTSASSRAEALNLIRCTR